MDTVIVVTYGFDYSHEETLGVFTSDYYARKAIKEYDEMLNKYDYVHKNTYKLNEAYDECN